MNKFETEIKYKGKALLVKCFISDARLTELVKQVKLLASLDNDLATRAWIEALWIEAKLEATTEIKEALFSMRKQGG